MSLSILPECFGDTEMIKILGFKRANHCSSIGEVANRMKSSYANRLAIGIIDKDKPGNVPLYFNQFELTHDYKHFEVKHLPDTKHYIVIVKPALESFLLNASSDLDVSSEKYGFKNLKALKRVTKSQHISKNQNFKNFVNTLKQKKGSPLKKLLEEVQQIIDQN